MSAVQASALEARGRRRPVPWSNLAWVTWRQHRLALIGSAGLLGALGLWMAVNGMQIRAAMSALGLTGCHPATGPVCAAAMRAFQGDGYTAVASTFVGLLPLAPAMIGVFVGGPLLARELETGTYRFAWTQGCGRTRWTAAKLVGPAAVLVAGAVGLELVSSWYAHTFVAFGSVMRPTFFDVTGVDLAAWTVAAFAIAAFAGAAIRRTVPAMIAAAASCGGLFFLTTHVLRKRYETPVIVHGAPPLLSRTPGPWVIGGWWTDPGGHVLGQPAFLRVLARIPKTARTGPAREQASVHWLAQHGYSLWLRYQPADRFWRFQLIEAAWLVALAVLLGLATMWVVRRRSG